MEYGIFILAPAMCWLVLRLVLPNALWDFDPDVVHGSFLVIFQYFVKLASGLVVGDAALAVYGARHEVPFGARDFLLAGAVYGILFLVWTLLNYQIYLHARYKRDGTSGESTYTTARYAMTRTLVYSTVAFSLGGIVWTILSL
jgi:hypothetical protein